MRLLFLTQGASLAPFHDLALALRRRGRLEAAGYYVSDSRHFDSYVERRPDLLAGGAPIAKEWEIVRRARAGAPDLERLRALEAAWGPLRASIVADRRLVFGPRATYAQDYGSRFDERTLLRLVEEGVAELERLFDAVKPDAVLSFICVTFGEHLAWRMARARGIRFLNLRPTRIRNYVHWGESVHEPSARVRAALAELEAGGGPREALAVAREQLASVRAGDARYEGVIPASRRPPAAPFRPGAALARAASLWREERAFRREGHLDHHLTRPLDAFLHRRLWGPLRARAVDRRLRGGYVGTGDLAGLDYAFFPLHVEPEVTLLVYSPHCLNQIEAARLLAQALPAGMTLVVKDHPAAIGKRPVSYYEKLLEIPNLRLADPALASRELVEGARFVATIAGSIGLEAALRGKPVLTLGATPFELIGAPLVRRAAMDAVPAAVAELLAGFRPDDEALVRYLAAVIGTSTPVDWYSVLLKKSGAYRPDGATAADDAWSQQVERLADSVVPCLQGDWPRG